MAFSRSSRPNRTPIPVGPAILWPEKAMKSHPMAWTSSGMCPADWAASIDGDGPTFRARAQSSATGFMVASVLETCVNANSFTSGVSTRSRAEGRRPSSPVTGRYSGRRPSRCATSCQGTRLLWCSISVRRMTSPFLRFAPPQLEATRFMDSVVPRVKMTSSGAAALMNLATRARAPSYPSVERIDSAWRPRWTLALSLA